MLKEFAVLGNILTDISDNSAVISCENAFALLEHEGCQDLSKIAAPGYQLPKSSELETCSSRIQVVKKSFLRKFWLSPGRQALRDIARQRLEEVRALFFGFVLFVFECSLTILFCNPSELARPRRGSSMKVWRLERLREHLVNLDTTTKKRTTQRSRNAVFVK